jgi:hypothetical protein
MHSKSAARRLMALRQRQRRMSTVLSVTKRDSATASSKRLPLRLTLTGTPKDSPHR